MASSKLVPIIVNAFEEAKTHDNEQLDHISDYGVLKPYHRTMIKHLFHKEYVDIARTYLGGSKRLFLEEW
jgi:hypothetical protein